MAKRTSTKTTKVKRKKPLPVAQPIAVPLLFKVLVDDKSCHGGKAQWPPIGEWTEATAPRCCESGWHLTSDPLCWWKPNATLWLCEAEGPISGDNTDKAAFARVRRLLEITDTWPLLPMFPRIRCFLAASARSRDPKANLYGSNLSGANLSEADLSGANLSGANLSWANLSGADLSWANLSWANLYGSNLFGANLSEANLSMANLSMANLSEADSVPVGWQRGSDGLLSRKE